VIAALFLGETFNVKGIAGAALFLSALVIAAVTPPESEEPAAAAAAFAGDDVEYYDYAPLDGGAEGEEEATEVALRR
jgi:hypothetical protein